MRRKCFVGFLICLLLAYGSPSEVWGWSVPPCVPPCNNCQDCVAGACVKKPTANCDDIFDCDVVNCYECNYTTCNCEPYCDDCEVCMTVVCECFAECGCGGKTCSGCCECVNCSCEPKDSECGNCQECNANCECVKKAGAECDDSSDCEPEEHCLVWPPYCECYCDGGSCWVTNYVPPLEEECDACDDFFIGCTDIVEIRDSYTRWIAAIMEGYCKNPKKKVTVGYIYRCTEVYSEALFAGCAAIIATVCYYPCQGGWAPCALCIIGVGAACAYPDGLCTFVEECVPGDVLMPVEIDVVDNEGDWGNYQKCGIIS